jgi:hypothetical protein
MQLWRENQQQKAINIVDSTQQTQSPDQELNPLGSKTPSNTSDNKKKTFLCHVHN